ncbi:MAG: triose-phosphate isomerase [Gammaproteobacteria bacterium]|nr:triose-phosphate isomerase [Gammaproteobacteria bacterium]MYE49089.1 triose-phosphate isomerase [Gammaproteobacteria bacterium]MYF66684.1 triose-phosphate isomerase [Gammaproteobacteria bacterium]MYK37004.1 triose-phosphate isomerase [Gammaproteobacteria bacterium]
MTDRRRIVAGNWKMHGSLVSASELAGALAATAHEPGRGLPEVIVFPSFPHLDAVRRILENAESAGTLAVRLGAQDLSIHEQGAHTGEVSADMLTDCGCSHVLVGHSERRAGLRESDELVAKKFQRAADHGLVPVLCVGETLPERRAERTGEVVLRQLGAVLELCGADVFERAVLAYEPVWAIGTGHTATPGQAQQVHALLRGEIARTDAKIGAGLRILYGGSVNGANAAALFAQPDIDGGLVGGASLDAKEFLRIISAV